MDKNRPVTIGMHKVNHGQYVNAEHYWRLSCRLGDYTVEMRVRYHHEAPPPRFFMYDSGDEYEIVTPQQVEEHRQLLDMHRPCRACDADVEHSACENDGWFEKAMKEYMETHVTVGDGMREACAHLARTWDAFKLLFNPEVTL